MGRPSCRLPKRKRPRAARCGSSAVVGPTWRHLCRRRGGGGTRGFVPPALAGFAFLAAGVACWERTYRGGPEASSACSGSRRNKSFPRPMTSSPRTALTALRWLARALALAAAYFVVAETGLRYATIGPSISPVWPPTGLAVAALVLLGPGYW